MPDDVRKAFTMFDFDHSGDIDSRELRKALEAMGMETDESQTRGVLAKCVLARPLLARPPRGLHAHPTHTHPCTPHAHTRAHPHAPTHAPRTSYDLAPPMLPRAPLQVRQER